MEKKSIATCPICGSTVHERKEWHQCRLHKTAVCMECCRMCKYNLDGALNCSYGRDQVNQEEEIKKLEAQKRAAEGKMRYFYKTSKPYIAEKYEAEANWIEQEIRRIKKAI